MDVVEYREDCAGNSTLYMDFELKGEDFSVEYQSQSGATAGIRIENSDELVYSGTVDSLYPPANQEELMEHVEEAWGNLLSPEIAEELLDNPEKVQGVPGDEIVYVPKKEFDISKI